MKVLILSLLFICFGCASNADLAFELANQCRIAKGAGNCDPEWAAYNKADEIREKKRLRILAEKNRYPCPDGQFPVVNKFLETYYCTNRMVFY